MTISSPDGHWPTVAGGAAPGPARHPASFRDPGSGVLVHGGRVFRFFTGGGLADYQELEASGLLDRLASRGLAVACRPVPADQSPELRLGLPGDARIVEHPRVPFVSYAYEWPFGMLQAAALLHLEILLTALDAGFTLKDASPQNVQFVGTRPTLVDIGSFTRYVEGQPWRAYTQFCHAFLNPLLLSALTGVRYHPWLRGAPEGLSSDELSRLLGLRHKLRPVVLTNVVLQASLQRWFDSARPADLGGEAQVSRRSLVRNVEGLMRAIGRLTPPATRSAWTAYEEANTYSPEARAQKAAFVEEALAAARPGVVWDLGANRGQHALIASRHAGTVVAVDGDAAVAELLYRRARQAGAGILSLVVDLLNPSPNQGWAEAEQQGLLARGPADLVLSLALLHHLAIAGNVPLRRIVAWLGGVARRGVLEFVPASDPLAVRLSRWRGDLPADYSRAALEAALAERFAIRRTHELPGTGRVLYDYEESGRR